MGSATLLLRGALQAQLQLPMALAIRLGATGGGGWQALRRKGSQRDAQQTRDEEGRRGADARGQRGERGAGEGGHLRVVYGQLVDRRNTQTRRHADSPTTFSSGQNPASSIQSPGARGAEARKLAAAHEAN